MGRMYVAVLESAVVTTAIDLFEINSPSDATVILHAVFVSQKSDAGDAQDEMMPISIVRGYTSSGSGGSAQTAALLSGDNTAFGGTLEILNTTLATGGSPVTVHADAWNVRAGWVYEPPEERRILMQPSTRLVVTSGGAPADSLSICATCLFEEIN